MKSHRFYTILLTLLLLAGGAGSSRLTWAGQIHPTTSEKLNGFDLLLTQEGWLWLGSRLYITVTGGQTWQDITPLAPDRATICAVFFTTSNQGWVVSSSAGQVDKASFILSHTQDAGSSWQSIPLNLPFDTLNVPISAVYTHWIDAQTGWLVFKQATGSQFSAGVLFRTVDGGQTWMQLSIPIGEPVQFTSAREGWVAGGPAGDELHRTTDGGETWQRQAQEVTEADNNLAEGVSKQDMVTPDIGWARGDQGNCDATGAAIECSTETRLLATQDGGVTWVPLTLPQVGQAITNRFTVANQFLAQEGVGGQGIGSLTQTMIGQGFDKCEIATAGQLQTWMDHSPYRAVNLYIGGSCRACGNSALNASLISSLTQQGWRFIPTWVGPQSNCQSLCSGSRISNDSATAYNQGVSNADAAIEAAYNLGLALPDKSGTIIYYDLEVYNTGDSVCHNAAKSFISGWTARLRERGNQSGVYGYGPAIAAFSAIPNVPDAIWPAHWIYSAYNPDATVWGAYGISDGLWSNHQRIRQYAGGHDETWGGVTFNIDCDVLDGIVSIIDPTPPTTSASFSGIAGEDGWYRSNVQITLSATDNSGGSGVKLTQYRIDGGEWQTYGGPFPVAGDGVHTVGYRSQDNAGNWEAEKTSSIKIDAAAPTGSLALNNNASTSHTSLVYVNATASDAHSGVYQMRMRDAGGSWTDWLPFSARTPWQLPAVTGQTHTVEIEIRDRAGNISPIYQDAIALNIYPARPASAGYRLARSTWGAIGTNGQSVNYRLLGTLSQSSMIGRSSSASYRLWSGYWLAVDESYLVYLPIVLRNRP